MDTKEIVITIDYETAGADLHRLGTLEACILYRAARNMIIAYTGMEPEKFLEGMRELFAPVKEDDE